GVTCYKPTIAVVFFFQAEDGIRARNVTGVQTCALPILTAANLCNRASKSTESRTMPSTPVRIWVGKLRRNPSVRRLPKLDTPTRSEERRVGKERKPRCTS